MKVFGNFSNASLLSNLRYRLIRWLAGDAVVVLNARLSARERAWHEADVGIEVRGPVNGMYLSDNTFPWKGPIVVIEQDPRSQTKFNASPPSPASAA